MKATPDVNEISLSTLFDAVWQYEEFHRVEFLGPGNQAQAFGFTPDAGCRVDGERIAGSLRLVQFPQVRADGPLLPDAHGLIETDSGQAVIVRAAGFAVPIPDTPGDFSIRHWMRFKTAAPELLWLNATVAFGVGRLTHETARLRYFAVVPAPEPGALPDGGVPVPQR